jgi:hypothetical protein
VVVIGVACLRSKMRRSGAQRSHGGLAPDPLS